MARRTVLTSTILTLLAGAAACSGSPSATSPPSAGPAPDSAAAAMVQRACSGAPPTGVSSAIPGAAASFTPANSIGPSCSWSGLDDTVARHVVALAVTSGSFDSWVALYAGGSMNDHTSVGGFPAVRGSVADGCTVLVNVDGKALEVDLVGVPDPGCSATTHLAGQVASTR